jgi:hypothetical protein
MKNTVAFYLREESKLINVKAIVEFKKINHLSNDYQILKALGKTQMKNI